MSPENGNADTALAPKLLSIRQVAEVLTVSEKTVWRRIKNGELRASRLGRHVKVKPRDLDDYVAALPAYTPDDPS